MATSNTDTGSDVPNCHLYTLEPSQRIANELIELGIKPEGSSNLDVMTLNQIDGMRYEGDKGTFIFCQHLDDSFGKDANVSVLDVGSGFGGPSRLLALKRPTTNVVALEYVPEISSLAESLTARCDEVADSIDHVTGDIAESDLTISNNTMQKGDDFHAAQAVLSLLHVPDIESALANICRCLTLNGILYIEDFYVDGTLSLSQEAKANLSSIVGCPRMPMSEKDWRQTLNAAGFPEIEFINATSTWQPWVHGRARAYKNELDRHVRIQGKERASHMLEFYETMDRLFSTELRGCRILAKK